MAGEHHKLGHLSFKKRLDIPLKECKVRRSTPLICLQVKCGRGCCNPLILFPTFHKHFIFTDTTTTIPRQEYFLLGIQHMSRAPSLQKPPLYRFFSLSTSVSSPLALCVPAKHRDAELSQPLSSHPFTSLLASGTVKHMALL